VQKKRFYGYTGTRGGVHPVTPMVRLKLFWLQNEGYIGAANSIVRLFVLQLGSSE